MSEPPLSQRHPLPLQAAGGRSASHQAGSHQTAAGRLTFEGAVSGWAPSWLLSGVLHLLALNLLAWFGFQYGATGNAGAVVVAFAAADAPLDENFSEELAATIDLAARPASAASADAHTENSFADSDSHEELGITLGDLKPLEVEAADSSTRSTRGDSARLPSSTLAMAALPLDTLAPSAAPAGKQAEFFGVNATGNTFVFIVDCSRSMIGARFEAAKRELLYAVRRLSPSQRFYVIFFDGMTKPMRLDGEFPYNAAPVLATQTNLTQLEAWVHSVPNGPWTNPSGAIDLALDLRPDAIYLLSDGDFTDHGATRKTLARRNLDAQRRPQVTLHTIGLHSRDGEATLRSLAKTHGGEYRFVPVGH